MENINVSIIFATYNRSDIIESVLDSWLEVSNHTKYSFEIICSDDESTDNTVELLKKYDKLPIVVLKNPHGGASRARNAALKIAKGELIVFTGDDIYPTVDFIDRHYENYKKFGSKMCTLGRTEWYKDIPMNHLMTHITNIGCEQFGFAGLIPYGIADFRHFYTSNISVARSELEKLDKFFDLSFDRYGFEDVELGYRLYKNGVNITYDPDVLAYHNHVYDSVEKFCNRQLNAGSQMRVITKLHPELAELPVLGVDRFEPYIKKALDDYLSLNEKVIFERGIAVREFVDEKKKRTIELEKLIAKDDLVQYRNECSALYRFIFQFYCYVGWGERFASEYNKNIDLESESFASFLYETIYDYVYSGYIQVYLANGGNLSEENSYKIEKRGFLFDLDVDMENISWFRLDPYTRPCVVTNLKMVDEKGKDIQFRSTNGSTANPLDFSNEYDSQINVRFLTKQNKTVKVSFELHSNMDLEEEMRKSIEEESYRNNNYYRRVEQGRKLHIYIDKDESMLSNYVEASKTKFKDTVLIDSDNEQKDFYTNYTCAFKQSDVSEKDFIEACKELASSFVESIDNDILNIKMMGIDDSYQKEESLDEKEDKPLISVVIPSYNHEKYIEYAIDSVLNQIYSNLELIIIDDGSKDSSVEIIKAYQDERVKLVVQENAGAHNAINKGLAMAKGEYLAVLNSDDSFSVRRFEIMIKEMKNQNADFACSYIQVIDSDNNNLAVKRGSINLLSWEIEQPGKSYYTSDDFNANLILSNFTSTTSNFLFTRKLYEDIGGMRNLRFAHDWDFILRAAQRYNCITVELPLMEYRVHNANTISSNRKWMLFEVLWMWATNLDGFYRNTMFNSNDKEDVTRLGYSLNMQGNDKVYWMIKTFLEEKKLEGVEHPEELLLDDAELRQRFIDFIVE